MRDLGLRTSNMLFSMVEDENQRQLDKWGIQDRHPFAWLACATEEHGEMAKAIFEHIENGQPIEDIIKEAVQTATLCLKIAEMFLEAADGQSHGHSDTR